MKIYMVPLTEQEADLILKTLDSTSTRGIETQRIVIALADKILSVVRASNGATKTPSGPVLAAAVDPREATAAKRQPSAARQQKTGR